MRPLSPQLSYCDAHCHFQDPVFDQLPVDFFSHGLAKLSISRAIVNATNEADWDTVAALCANHPALRPAFGIHPWHCGSRSQQWADKLHQRLLSTPTASVGETGLDRWKKPFDIDDQLTVFRTHLDIANALQRPVTIHCLNAWQLLLDTLRSSSKPRHGFLIHAFNGSAEVGRQLLDLGACFSFSTYFLHPNKQRLREFYRQLPIDHLLVETDAPAMAPPRLPAARFLHHTTAQNHPANLRLAYAELARLRNSSLEVLCSSIRDNCERLFNSSDYNQ